ncbi:hypothetical protein QCA50_007758 [Cerrena zonata]|uniref:DUF6534 domain-containing protein n=1 Tax=Cerrena zonata TaxID=2478898 RepID=A0AAW0GGH5_9APHY
MQDDTISHDADVPQQLFVLAARLGLHTTIAAYAAISDSWMTFAQHIAATMCLKVSNVTAAALDGVIALCIIYFLGRDHSQYKSTNGMLRWLMMYTVNTGALSMAASICVAITYSCLPNTLTFVGVAAMVTKLYSNSFLGALNAREIMRDKLQSHPVVFGSSGTKSQKGSTEKNHVSFSPSKAETDSSATYGNEDGIKVVSITNNQDQGAKMV